MNEAFVTTKTLLKKSLIFLRKNPDLFLIYLILQLISFIFFILTDKKIHFLSGHFVFLPLIFHYASLVYYFFLPILISKRINHQQIITNWVFREYRQLFIRLLGPCIFLFLVFFLPFAIYDFATGINIFELNLRQNIGFYPQESLNALIAGIVGSTFIYTFVLFSLKEFGFFKSVKESIKLFFKKPKVIFLIANITTVYYSIFYLFLPNGDWTFVLINTLLLSFLQSLITTAVFFYFTENIEHLLPVEKTPDLVNPNVIFRRIFASIIDILIFILLLIIIDLSLKNNYFYNTMIDTGYYLLFMLIIYLLYFIIFESLIQASLGKKFLGIKGLSIDGSRAHPGQIIVRNLLRVVDLIPFIVPYLIGLIIVASSDKKQRIGDLIAKTIVSR